MSLLNMTKPICVDLDGTLCKVDTLIESFLRAFRLQPWILVFLPIWILKGKAYLKAQLSIRGTIDATVLPYNAAVVDMIVQARKQGRHTVLITGCNSRIAESVNAHLGLFDEVVASDDKTNITGSKKAGFLLDKFGVNGYEYLGNGSVDIPVWKNAAIVVTVNAPRKVVALVSRFGKPHVDIPRQPVSLRSLLKAIRIHQWSKNALLFIPLITSHKVLEIEPLRLAFLAFLSFGLCASATYIVNDLFDLDADRHHKKKCQRPFAAGNISASAGCLLSAVFLVASFSLALLMPIAFQITLLIYLVSTLLYSFRLKKVASLDVVILAGLYTLRIGAGAFAIDVRLSFWLLAFSMFMFLSLALVKRVAELIELGKSAFTKVNEKIKIVGREYAFTDVPLLQTMGACSGYLSVLVLALYINSSEVTLLYRTPELLWFIIPLILLWVTRLWIVTSRGYMNDDPIVFAIKDPETWITVTVMVVFITLATFVKLNLAG